MAGRGLLGLLLHGNGHDVNPLMSGNRLRIVRVATNLYGPSCITIITARRFIPLLVVVVVARECASQSAAATIDYCARRLENTWTEYGYYRVIHSCTQ